MGTTTRLFLEEIRERERERKRRERDEAVSDDENTILSNSHLLATED
jgi:hypothetical protein